MIIHTLRECTIDPRNAEKLIGQSTRGALCVTTRNTQYVSNGSGIGPLYHIQVSRNDFQPSHNAETGLSNAEKPIDRYINSSRPRRYSKAVPPLPRKASRMVRNGTALASQILQL